MLEKEVFKVGKENGGMRAGLYSNVDSPIPLLLQQQQQRRKELGLRTRSPARRRPSYTLLLLIAGLLFVAGFFFVGPPWHPNPSQYVPMRVSSGDDATTEVGLRLDFLARQLGDQLTLCKSYIVIAKENNNLQLAWHLSAQIRAAQQLLSEAATRGSPVLWEEAEPIMREMSDLVSQAKDLHYDSATMLMRLKAEMQALEEMANTAATQSATFGQLAAEAVPKSLHCLSLRLATKWGNDETLREDAQAVQERFTYKFTDNSLYHFCVFSDNVLATSVVINSTIMNANHPEHLVFHVVTDAVNEGLMKAWFALNYFKGVAIEIQRVESFTWLNATYVPVLKQLQDTETKSYYFRSSGKEAQQKTALKFRNPKYLSMLNHLRFYIPEVYPALEKVVFLDDDVVVQRDLSGLFFLDLHDNVNAAVETCLESFHRFHKYLNFSHPKIKSHFDPDACGWAFGMNVFDLVRWREKNVTARYHYWQEQNVDRTLWKLGTLPAGLLAFYGLTEPLDRRWHVLGLGYDAHIDAELIERGAVVHYNGNMKPWLKLAMSRYKPLWERYVDYQNAYLQRCNAFHAVKITFANEMVVLAERMGINGAEVMAKVCEDQKLNASVAYLRSGFAFGESCLPKDLRAIVFRAGRLDVKLPMLENVFASNGQHVARGIQAVLELPAMKIAMLGLAFKANTDDLRESPSIPLIEHLLGKGRDISVYDPHIRLEDIYGSKKNYNLRAIPDVCQLLINDVDGYGGPKRWLR